MAQETYPTKRMLIPTRFDHLTSKYVQTVRKKDGKFQVQVVQEVSMPYGQPIDEWFASIKEGLVGFEGVTVDHKSSWMEDEPDTLEASGWHDATPKQLEAIEEAFPEA